VHSHRDLDQGLVPGMVAGGRAAGVAAQRRSGALDYWGTFMRDSAQELQARYYVERNPVKAGLVKEPRAWPWSSTRFRDPYGHLIL
jgi:hypothetical protein